MAAILAKQSQQFKDWVDNATENQLVHVFAFIRNKEQVKMPVYQMLHHVFNHATYHRGQLVTMLRQLGVDKIPSTDFSTFCRKK
ncbi:MAG: DinB family protein, partial [Ferruginibacter sp.]